MNQWPKIALRLRGRCALVDQIRRSAGLAADGEFAPEPSPGRSILMPRRVPNKSNSA